MKNFSFKNVEIRTDKGKTTPELTHDYKPYKDDDNVIFKCMYLKNGEGAKYILIGNNGKATYNMEDIFKDKVLSIKGIGAIPKGSDKPVEITNAEDFLQWPQNADMYALMSDVVTHIMAGSDLTEDEIKNFN